MKKFILSIALIVLPSAALANGFTPAPVPTMGTMSIPPCVTC